MHLLVLGGGDETISGFALIDRPIAMDHSTSWLGFRRFGGHRLGGPLGVVEPLSVVRGAFNWAVIPEFGMQHRSKFAHALAPFRILAMWMCLTLLPDRSAQPCWWMRQELSDEVT